MSWVCYRQQRSRLSDIDPATYASGGSGSNGGGSGSNGNSAGGWQPTPDVSVRREGDGMPLLYHAPQHHFDLQQPQQQQSGVGALAV